MDVRFRLITFLNEAKKKKFNPMQQLKVIMGVSVVPGTLVYFESF